MAGEQSQPRPRHSSGDHGNLHADGKRKHRSKHSSSHSKRSSTVDNAPDDKPTTVDELRKLRVEYHSKSPEEKRQSAMKYVYEPRDSQRIRHGKGSSKSTKPKKDSLSGHHRHRKETRDRSLDEGGEYVYHSTSNQSGTAVRPEVKEVIGQAPRRRPSREKKADHESTVHRTASKSSRSSASSRASTTASALPERRRTVAGHKPDSRRPLQIIEEDCERPSMSRTWSRREPPPRRPSLRRSATSASRPKADIPLPKRSTPARSVAESTSREQRTGSSIFGTFFGGGSTTHVPEKKVTCLTCMADDIPISKSAKLPCSHRMCHACLRRIFKLSITDPAHMPPRCCTNDHIPLKHVEKLFDMKFKVKWNRKFQEYTTRNRIYCPSRGCGEWIKPAHITMEYGRKVGTCKRCRTRVCCTCNNKMHKSKDCPKDEATKQFIETAKNEGWQRCYNCSAMVELKEGCNHMTCRCTAEFCMICGLKWKTCDCPWFNYNAVETDRLLNMNIPQARRAFVNGEGREPLRYQEELDRQREQEQRDEQMARRMQGLNFDGHGDPDGDLHINIVGIGNAGEHFLNEDFVQRAREVLMGNFRHAHQEADALLNGAVTGRENPLLAGPLEPPLPDLAGQPPRLRRHHTATRRAYNTDRTPRQSSERVVPARRSTDYATEAAVNRPDRLVTGARQSTSGLFDQADPNGNEREQRIENWMDGVHGPEA